MHDVSRHNQTTLSRLRATLASLGFGMLRRVDNDVEQWNSATHKLSVTIQRAELFARALRVTHDVGNLRVFELPPGATVSDQNVRFSPTEYSILLGLIKAQDQYLTHVELTMVADQSMSKTATALTVHIHNMRRKLALKRANVRIETKRNRGYKLTASRLKTSSR
jgi:DNA-binding response OmpR family regulator